MYDGYGLELCGSKTDKFVAGPGIEPGSGGYEPPEVPLLYPAVSLLDVRNIIPK